LSELTRRRLRELIDYDPATGAFSWRVSRQRVNAGDRAGTLSVYGYRVICIDGACYRGGRLAWFYVRGRWPREQIDHRDRDRANDRFENLRLATQLLNNQNRGAGDPRSRKARRARRIENLYLKGWRQGWAL
jgi:hypothetical protein